MFEMFVAGSCFATRRPVLRIRPMCGEKDTPAAG